MPVEAVQATLPAAREVLHRLVGFEVRLVLGRLATKVMARVIAGIEERLGDRVTNLLLVLHALLVAAVECGSSQDEGAIDLADEVRVAAEVALVATPNLPAGASL